MGYEVPGHRDRVNYYSNPAVTLPATGTPTGVAGESDVARVFMENIDTVSALGDESGSCSTSSICPNVVFCLLFVCLLTAC